MLGTGELSHIDADFGNDGRRCRGIDSRDGLQELHGVRIRLQALLNAGLQLSDGLVEKAETLTLDHLERTAMPKDKLDVQLNAITLGEGDFARAEPENADEELLQSLGLDAPKEQESKPKEKAEGQEKESGPPSAKLRPGDRKPGRDPLRPPEAEQQRDEGDISEDESAG